LIARGDADAALADVAEHLVRHVGRSRVAVASYDESGGRHVEVARGLGTTTVEALLEGIDGRAGRPDARSRADGVVVFESALDPRSGRPVGGVLVVLDQPRELVDHEATAIAGAGKLTATALDQRRQHRRLAYEATYDELTGVRNRSYLRDRIAQAARRRDLSIAVMLIDLDRFQLVNDSYGHEFGDQLLHAFSRRLASVLEPEDVLARFGSDEFAVLIAQRHETDAAEVVAERLTNALHEPFAVAGRELHVTVGIGIARRNSNECESVDQLLAEVDAALAESKQLGRGVTTVFEPEIQQRIVTRLEREHDLRHALAHDELTLHYQPTVALATGEVVGVEALVRWVHPDEGVLTPESFVPHAEEAGLAAELGEWVLSHAVAQAAAWLADGVVDHPFLVAVNVAASQIASPGFADLVDDVLRRYGWPASDLVVEVTETSLMSDCELAREQLARLEALGVRLAIDDFGTGYSSLSYLHRFAVDMVKLDRSLVAAIGHDETGSAVAKAVATIAQTLELTSVAEGIETSEQYDAARSLGFDWGQGALLSPAVTPEACRDLLEGWRR
jgi:diguanylate cyclase (GGDEF)-like protein